MHKTISTLDILSSWIEIPVKEKQFLFKKMIRIRTLSKTISTSQPRFMAKSTKFLLKDKSSMLLIRLEILNTKKISFLTQASETLLFYVSLPTHKSMMFLFKGNIRFEMNLFSANPSIFSTSFLQQPFWTKLSTQKTCSSLWQSISQRLLCRRASNQKTYK